MDSRFLFLSSICLVLGACGGTETADSGVDAGRPDATTDGGPIDHGFIDDLVIDVGPGLDTGVDAGDIDGGPSDSGAIDESDLGMADAGSDLGTDDAGPGGPCRHDSDCLASEWCAIPDGSCGGDGTCATVPAACTGTMMVCGCDGATHTSACDAHMHRTSVAHSGACTCPTTVPVGCCYSNAACSGGATCRAYSCPSPGSPSPGVCEPPTTGFDCWDDRDCGGGASCVGANVCPCGSACLLPDSPGLCMTL